MNREFLGKHKVVTELTVIEAKEGARKVDFKVYTRQGLDLLRRPEPTEKGNLFTDPEPIPPGTKVYVEHPFTDGYWEFVVTQFSLAESESILVNLEFDEDDKYWVARFFCHKAAIERVTFKE